MPLLRDFPSTRWWVRWVEAERIELSEGLRETSFLLTPNELRDWPPASFAAIDAEACAALIALGPEIALIGTGERQRLLAPALLAEFLRRGIGIEVMDNRACARTFNLLAGEGRKVLAAFLIERR
ncbi:MAG: hypothetical protein KatS3mg125_1254 [Lysobacterales bacterium]|jgi:uncharacterized protein|nr:MAG: hypothetical protein KatS3mg125_1254 [Xanthomonadales bacterium]